MKLLTGGKGAPVRQSTLYQVPSTKYQVPSTKYQVPSTKYQVPSTKYQVPSTKYQVPIPQFLNFSRLFLKTFIKSQGYTSPNIEVISTFLYQALAMQTTHRSTSTRSTKMREDLFIGAIIRKLATIIATIIKMWLSSI